MHAGRDGRTLTDMDSIDISSLAAAEAYREAARGASLTPTSLAALVEGNVVAIFPVVDELPPDDDGTIDFTAGALVVHVVAAMPYLTWVGATDIYAGMTARSEVLPTVDLALARAIKLAGWTQARHLAVIA